MKINTVSMWLRQRTLKSRTCSSANGFLDGTPQGCLEQAGAKSRSATVPHRGVLSFRAEVPTAAVSMFMTSGLQPMQRREFISLIGSAAVVWFGALQAKHEL
jgi:hypothetical protein